MSTIGERRPVAPVTRRGFLRALAVGVAGAALAQAVPDVARTYFLPPPQGWTSRGLLFTLDDVVDAQREYNRLTSQILDRESGISIRFVKQWDVQVSRSRMDILYGWAALAPALAVPVLGG